MRPLSAGSARVATGLWGHRWFWLLLPWLLVVGVATVEIADALRGRAFHAGPLLSPVPALAAIRGGPRDVLALTAAALAVGLTGAVGQGWGGRGEADNHVVVLASVVAVGLAALLASAVRERREGELDRMRRVAEAAQLAVLSPVPVRAGGLRLAAGYRAAETDTLVGGDLYEAVVLPTPGRPDRTRLIVGDVRGKGLPAIRTAAAVLGAFREAAQYESALGTVAGRCSRAVARTAGDLAGAEGEELFVTAALVEIEGPVLRVAALGHPPPVLLTPAGCRPLVAEPLPPLGLLHQFAGAAGVAGAADGDPEEDGAPRGAQDVQGVLPDVTRWEPGDRLLLYTDGIDEARDEHGHFFPLGGTLETLRTAPTERLPELLLDAVARHAGRRLRDDAAVLVAEYERPGDRLSEEPPGGLSGRLPGSGPAPSGNCEGVRRRIPKSGLAGGG
ncbi:PP2C family protein-serine/threonine phosphatase [Streptomyces sp. TRM 70361]|uniref:PP2C family protein-serine/threonine phosphatase n=1 Tax=Streptomyces sp. TRM 70361 TaxID=3116553 RepID=UPI002E7B293B|nr:PP2C family protein-serine/threonine phosphatase [Streptomyces sp. TRM 70361]MEE1942365.1 PP2C family protein-serine/threonine phosphatase [Streptomyces sp. TRM 70361]